MNVSETPPLFSLGCLYVKSGSLPPVAARALTSNFLVFLVWRDRKTSLTEERQVNTDWAERQTNILLREKVFIHFLGGSRGGQHLPVYRHSRQVLHGYLSQIKSISGDRVMQWCGIFTCFISSGRGSTNSYSSSLMARAITLSFLTGGN